mgnify:CR=1 FL=1
MLGTFIENKRETTRKLKFMLEKKTYKKPWSYFIILPTSILQVNLENIHWSIETTFLHKYYYETLPTFPNYRNLKSFQRCMEIGTEETAVALVPEMTCLMMNLMKTVKQVALQESY